MQKLRLFKVLKISIHLYCGSHIGGQENAPSPFSQANWNLRNTCGIRAEYRKMRNIWTLRNNLILRKTGTSGIRGLTEYLAQRNTGPNGIYGRLRKIVYATSCQASGKTINSIELLKVMDVWLCRPLVNMSVICEFAKNFELVNATRRTQRKFPIIYKFSPKSRITRICSKFSGI